MKNLYVLFAILLMVVIAQSTFGDNASTRTDAAGSITMVSGYIPTNTPTSTPTPTPTPTSTFTPTPTPEMQSIIDYLLGRNPTPTPTDVNDDDQIDIADLIAPMQE